MRRKQQENNNLKSEILQLKSEKTNMCGKSCDWNKS